MMCLGVVFFWFNLFGIYWDSWFWGFVVFIKFVKNILPLFHQIFFCPPPFFGTPITYLWDHSELFHRLFVNALLNFFFVQSFFFLCFNLDEIYYFILCQLLSEERCKSWFYLWLEVRNLRYYWQCYSFWRYVWMYVFILSRKKSIYLQMILSTFSCRCESARCGKGIWTVSI